LLGTITGLSVDLIAIGVTGELFIDDVEQTRHWAWAWKFGCYSYVMCVFHVSEYIVTAYHNPGTVSTDAFLLNQSAQYGLAAFAACSEFLLEYYLWPTSKSSYHFVSLIGLVCCLLGDSFRKYAMYHAGTNFNHLIETHKRDDHRLVTDGVYGWCRHPSYAGWFLWAVGTQVSYYYSTRKRNFKIIKMENSKKRRKTQ
jgi:protein-S-isoprenylcysteine O-methyltransferase Ste14